jgi:hypothetical protein
MKRVVGFGEVIDKRLVLRNESTFNEQLGQLKGSVEVTVEKARSRRSLNQNAYYWGVVVKMISDELGYTPEEVHEVLKEKFNPKDLALMAYDNQTIEQVRIGVSTANLGKLDFCAYIERIQRWASEFLHLNIPDPNQEVSE